MILGVRCRIKAENMSPVNPQSKLFPLISTSFYMIISRTSSQHLADLRCRVLRCLRAFLQVWYPHCWSAAVEAPRPH